MTEEKVERTFEEKNDCFEVKLEGLEDGYRFTVRGNEEQVKKQRRVGASFIQFAKQAESAGWPLPWLVRVLIKFWSKYK
jgi:acid stress-induced BolA-like protein IbaG/YrbA